MGRSHRYPERQGTAETQCQVRNGTQGMCNHISSLLVTGGCECRDQQVTPSGPDQKSQDNAKGGWVAAVATQVSGVAVYGCLSLA